MNKFTFDPDHIGYKPFNFIKIVFLVMSFYIYPMMAAFRTNNYFKKVKGEEYDKTTWNDFWTLSYIIELVNLVDCILNFFKRIKAEDSSAKEVRFKVIAKTYFFGSFWLHLLALIPLQFLKLDNSRARLFFFIKMIRLVEGKEYFTKAYIMKGVKFWHALYLKKQIQRQKEIDEAVLKEDKVDLAEYHLETLDQDNNKQTLVLYLSYGIKVIELIHFIFILSFLFGMVWMGFVITTEDLYYNNQFSKI